MENPLQKSSSNFGRDILNIINKDFVVIGRTRIKSWHAWLAFGLILGLAMGIALVINRGRFEFSSAIGTTYYVATTGNDINTCTQAQDISTPKRTLNNAVKCLTAGSTLLVRGGMYDEVLWDVPSGTSWLDKVRIAAYPGETVWMSPSAPGADNHGSVVWFGKEEDVANRDQHYIEFDGINMDGRNLPYNVFQVGAGNSALGTWDAHHIRFQNAEIIVSATPDSTNVGIGVGSHGANTIIGGNEFINVKLHSSYSYGIYLAGPNNLVENSDIYDTGAAGVHIYNGGGASADNNIIRNNRIHDITRSQTYFTSTDTRIWGILVSGNNNQIYNNLIYNINFPYDGNQTGISVFTGSNNKIYNNTLYNNTTDGIKITSGTGISNTEVKNNIVYAGTGLNFFNGGTGTVESNNLFGANPLFVNSSVNDFHLQSTSPAINTGVTVPIVTTDFDGIIRPQGSAYDIGAYEYGGTVTSPPLSQTPYLSSPISLPGTIEAENYDNGGEGVAYHDLDPVNQSGAYRPNEGVDIQSASVGGYNVGWMNLGEWTEYSVNIPTAGTYDIQVQVAGIGTGGTIHIEFDGVDKTGPISIPDTGGWQNWTVVTVPSIPLSSGTQIMKISSDIPSSTTGYIGNLDWVKVVSSTTPTPTPTPTLAPAPLASCTVSFSPGLITNGQSSTLSWTSSNDADGTLQYSCSGNIGSGNTISGGSNIVTPTTTQTCTFTGVNSDGVSATCSASITVTEPTPTPTSIPTAQTPYTGTPYAIPGTIESENYDNGGEGVAYHDIDAPNQGGAYRSDSVDIEASTEATYDVGWIDSSEWLEYTVNVTSTDTFNLNARVTVPGQGGTFHIEMDGANITGPMTIPDTGGWQNWTTITSQVSLTQGQHIMRVYFDSPGLSGYVGNLNYIQFTSLIPTPTPTPTPIPDTTNPSVTSLDVQPRTGSKNTRTVSWTFTDSGGSYLKQAEIQRTPYNAVNCNETIKTGCSWALLKTVTAPAITNNWSSSTSVSQPKGTYWYGIQALDNAGNRGYEPAPIKVVR